LGEAGADGDAGQMSRCALIIAAASTSIPIRTPTLHRAVLSRWSCKSAATEGCHSAQGSLYIHPSMSGSVLGDITGGKGRSQMVWQTLDGHV